MTRRTVLIGLAAAALSTATTAAATPGIPVRIRVIKGSRQGPAAVDPRLSDLQPQLSRLAYIRWDEAGEQQANMEFKKPVTVALPSGERLEIEILESSRDTVTIEVRVPSSRTTSRLTISKDKRLVHQVTPEKAGEAFFVTVRPWP